MLRLPYLPLILLNKSLALPIDHSATFHSFQQTVPCVFFPFEKSPLLVYDRQQEEFSISLYERLSMSAYTGYAPFLVSAIEASTCVCCASLYLKNSVATCGNSA